MSYSTKFHVVLADPEDRRAAIAHARRLADALCVQRCEVRLYDLALARALVDRSDRIAVHVDVSCDPPMAVPLLVARGLATRAAVQVVDAAGVRTLLSWGFDKPTQLLFTGRTAPDLEAALRAHVLMAAAAGALVPPVDEAIATIQRSARDVCIPVYDDAFPLLASEVGLGWRGATSFQLTASVAPALARTLLGELPPALYAQADLDIPPDDDAAFVALAELCESAAMDDAELRWGTAYGWFAGRYPDGTIRDDALAHDVELSFADGLALRLGVTLDHCSQTEIADAISRATGVLVTTPPDDA